MDRLIELTLAHNLWPAFIVMRWEPSNSTNSHSSQVDFLHERSLEDYIAVFYGLEKR